jgi:hypothetical protein
MTTVAQGSNVTLVAEFSAYAGGPPVDLTGVTITITPAAGGAAVVGPTSTGVTHPGTGVYSYVWSVTVDEPAGDYLASWSGTDDTAQVVTAVEVVTVEAASVVADPFVTVAEVKAHMNKTSDADDAELAGFVSAACQMVVDRIGSVSPTAATQTAWGRHHHSHSIVLDLHPVVDVTAVTVDGVAVPEADPAAGTDGWVLDAGPGVLTHTRHWPWGRIEVTYRAGRTPLPGNIRMAGLELAAHLWQSSQLNSSGGRPSLSGTDELALRNVGFALPYRVRELLGLGKLPTSDVQVG